jgi:hypothetical protein
MALHALAYCPRLFYLEEVEGMRVADAAVYAGRQLHAALEAEEGGEQVNLELSSHALGLTGKVDCLCRRGGSYLPYEHERGQPWRRDGQPPAPWPSDRLRVIAYAVLFAEAFAQPIPEGRIRYHTAKVAVRVPVCLWTPILTWLGDTNLNKEAAGLSATRPFAANSLHPRLREFAAKERASWASAATSGTRWLRVPCETKTSCPLTPSTTILVPTSAGPSPRAADSAPLSSGRPSRTTNAGRSATSSASSRPSVTAPPLHLLSQGALVGCSYDTLVVQPRDQPNTKRLSALSIPFCCTGSPKSPPRPCAAASSTASASTG